MSSNSSSTHEFPSPVGGVPFPVDLGPSVLFTILYALLVPMMAWRLINPRTRNFALIGTIIFGVERVVSFALRANAAHVASARASENLETYLQTDYAGGFISIGQDLVMLLRTLLVDATLGEDMRARYALEARGNSKSSDIDVESTDVPLSGTRSLGDYANAGSEQSVMSMSFLGYDAGCLEDHPRTRFWVRRLCGMASIWFWVSVILGLVAGDDYKNAIDSGRHASLVQRLWYGSIGLALFLLVGLAIGAVYASYKVPRVHDSSAMWIVFLATLLSIVGIYRLDVMRFSTTSLFSTAPGSQNSTGSKAAFYVFHIVPEFLATAVLASLDVRRVFRTGLKGDWRYTDPKPKA